MLTGIPYTVTSHALGSYTANYASPIASGANATPAGLASTGFVIVPTTCTAYLTIYSNNNTITWALQKATYTGGATPTSASAYTTISSCTTNAANSYKCTISGVSIAAGTLLTVYNGTLPNPTTGIAAIMAFSCQ